MNVKPMAEIEAFLRPYAEAMGIELVEVKWDARTRSLTVFLDREGGIDLVTCEAFHRSIDLPLDELDPTFGAAYTLNCSSLGLDRPFRTARDFERHIGEAVEVHLYAPVGGKKLYEGELLGFDGSSVRISCGGEEKVFPFASCAKVCLLIEV